MSNAAPPRQALVLAETCSHGQAGSRQSSSKKIARLLADGSVVPKGLDTGLHVDIQARRGVSISTLKKGHYGAQSFS